MTLLRILRKYGFDPKSNAIMARHKDTRPGIDFEALVKSDHFEEYQCWQGEPVFHEADFVVSFIGDGGGRARFWGVYRIRGSQVVPYAKLPRKVPWPWRNKTPHYRYQLERLPEFDLLRGGLVVEWSGERRWAQRLKDSAVLEQPRLPKSEIVAVILKIKFGPESDVYSATYLDQMKQGEWRKWRTPRLYRGLVGHRRKLLLYDRDRKSLTVEAEIANVTETNDEDGYPWTNSFVPESLQVFEKPIGVDHIRTIAGLEDFGIHRKDRSPNRNLTRHQYESLLGNTALESDWESDSAFEGHVSEQQYLRRVRNRPIVEKRKRHDDYTCKACGFRLSVNNKFVVDCHHLVPLQSGEERITSIDELVCLCPTCHRIAHARIPPYTLEEVAELRGCASY